MLDTLHGCAVSWVPATCRLLEAFVICMIDWNRIIFSNAPDLFFLLYMRCRGLHNAQLPPCKFSTWMQSRDNASYHKFLAQFGKSLRHFQVLMFHNHRFYDLHFYTCLYYLTTVISFLLNPLSSDHILIPSCSQKPPTPPQIQ